VLICPCHSYCDNEEHFCINLLQPTQSVHNVIDDKADMRGQSYFKRLSKLLCAQYFFYLDLHLQGADSGSNNWSAEQWNLTDSIPLRDIIPDATQSRFYEPQLGLRNQAADWIAEGAFEAGPFAKSYQYGPLSLSLYNYDCRKAERKKSYDAKRNTTGEVRHCHLQPGSASLLDWDHISQMWHLSDHEKFICSYPVTKDSDHTIITTDGDGVKTITSANHWSNTKLIGMYVPPDATPPESQLSQLYGADNLTLLERIEHAMYDSRLAATETGADTQLYSIEDVQKYTANRMFKFWRGRAMPSVELKTPYSGMIPL
jgi:hypothetical protein